MTTPAVGAPGHLSIRAKATAVIAKEKTHVGSGQDRAGLDPALRLNRMRVGFAGRCSQNQQIRSCLEL